jgi:hypothetical protein
MSRWVSAPATTRPAAAAPALLSSHFLLTRSSGSDDSGVGLPLRSGSELLRLTTSSWRLLKPLSVPTSRLSSAFSRSNASSLCANPCKVSLAGLRSPALRVSHRHHASKQPILDASPIRRIFS